MHNSKYPDFGYVSVYLPHDQKIDDEFSYRFLVKNIYYANNKSKILKLADPENYSACPDMVLERENLVKDLQKPGIGFLDDCDGSPAKIWHGDPEKLPANTAVPIVQINFHYNRGDLLAIHSMAHSSYKGNRADALPYSEVYFLPKNTFGYNYKKRTNSPLYPQTILRETADDIITRALADNKALPPQEIDMLNKQQIKNKNRDGSQKLQIKKSHYSYLYDKNTPN